MSLRGGTHHHCRAVEVVHLGRRPEDGHRVRSAEASEAKVKHPSEGSLVKEGILEHAERVHRLGLRNNGCLCHSAKAGQRSRERGWRRRQRRQRRQPRRSGDKGFQGGVLRCVDCVCSMRAAATLNTRKTRRRRWQRIILNDGEWEANDYACRD